MVKRNWLGEVGALGLLLLGTVGCTTGPGGEPLNLSDAKAAVVHYHDSGEYLAAVADVAAEAEAWLRERARTRQSDERLAVVFDIDETVLSNYPQMRSQDFGYVTEAWNDWVDRAEAPALAPVREVYRIALGLELEVIFITGRRDPRERAGTEENLERQGMGKYTRLILAPADSPHSTAAQRKAAARAALEAEGFTIIASIGDQYSDLTGGHAEKTFKLPNPFYRVP